MEFTPTSRTDIKVTHNGQVDILEMNRLEFIWLDKISLDYDILE